MQWWPGWVDDLTVAAAWLHVRFPVASTVLVDGGGEGAHTW